MEPVAETDEEKKTIGELAVIIVTGGRDCRISVPLRDEVNRVTRIAPYRCPRQSFATREWRHGARRRCLLMRPWSCTGSTKT